MNEHESERKSMKTLNTVAKKTFAKVRLRLTDGNKN